MEESKSTKYADRFLEFLSIFFLIFAISGIWFVLYCVFVFIIDLQIDKRIPFVREGAVQDAIRVYKEDRKQGPMPLVVKKKKKKRRKIIERNIRDH